YFLSVKEQGTMALGDAFVLVGAFFWAGHVQFIAHFSSLVRPMRLSCVQSLVTALLSFLVGIVWEDTTWRMVVDAAGPILYGGVISIGFAYTLQIIAQQDARPTHAAIILSLESVFAALWGWLFLGEVLSIRGGFGAGLMLSGMILAQVQFARQREEREWELHP
ncbi:MAG: DMT family transporter, partial [Chloroflexota bacterium]